MTYLSPANAYKESCLYLIWNKFEGEMDVETNLYLSSNRIYKGKHADSTNKQHFSVDLKLNLHTVSKLRKKISDV